MRGAIVLVVVTLLIFVGLVMLARWRSERTWTPEEFERERKEGTTLGNAILATQAVFNPGAQHALEQRTVEDADETDSGAPPDPGTDD